MLNILFVEDEPLARRVMLSEFGKDYEVHFAADGAEARQALSADTRWDAFVIDIGLPDESGLRVAELARKLHPCVPALVVTGGDFTADRVNEVFAIGAQLASKPLPRGAVRRFLEREDATDALVECVSRHSDRWSTAAVAAAGSMPCVADLDDSEWPDVLDRIDAGIATALDGTAYERARFASSVH